MKQYYHIAGLVVNMDTFGRTEEQARAYLCDDSCTPDIVIESYRNLLLSKYPTMEIDLAEYLGTGGNFYKQLLNFNGFQLHSSAVVVDNKAYLFTANSGTGKSTHTGLWLKKFGDRAFILNDDKPALRLEEGRWYAYGTPWSGKHDISVNARVPLAGIAVIERAQENHIELFKGNKVILEILRQSNRPKEMEYRIKLLELLDKLITQIPIWKLRCNMQPEAAVISYEAMAGKKL